MIFIVILSNRAKIISSVFSTSFYFLGMKVLEFNYKTNPEVRKLVFQDDADANVLFNDILSARNQNKDTILITGSGQIMMINPLEILELILKDIPSENNNGI